MKYYTIFLGNKMWQDTIDDMNTTKAWSYGGMLWSSKKKATDCVRNLKKYDFETEKIKFNIKILNKI